MNSLKKDVLINRIAIISILKILGLNQKEIKKFYKECENSSEEYLKNEGGVKNEKPKNNDK